MEGVGNLTRVVRLRDKLAALWQQLQVAPAEPRRDDDLNRRPSPTHGMREFDPIHGSRHVNVSEHNSDIVAAFQDTNGIVRVRRPERLKSRVAKIISTASIRIKGSSSTASTTGRLKVSTKRLPGGTPNGGEHFPAISSILQRQRETFDPSQINNRIVLPATRQATCQRLDWNWSDTRSGRCVCVANQTVGEAKRGIGSAIVSTGPKLRE